jgi:hypothetical protein
MPTREQWAHALKGASDEQVGGPLWRFPPIAIPAVLHERRKRNILQNDPEPSGDHEYN